MSRKPLKRCPKCGVKRKDVARHLPLCERRARAEAQASKNAPDWRNPKPPSGRNTVNRYTCPRCDRALVTVDRHDGVTPFMLACTSRDCDGNMRSGFYMCPQTLEPTHEWRFPTEAEYRAAHPLMREHFDKGGLEIHPIGSNAPPWSHK